MDPRLATEWPAIAGPELARLCRPVRIIRRGKSQALELSVTSGAAAMRVQYAQEALLSRVRHQLGLPHLTRIVLRESAGSRGWERRQMRPELHPDPGADAASAPCPPASLREALERMRQTIHGEGR